MIFTLYYMYATFIQWWRLGALKNKLNGTLSGKNALLVSTGNTINKRCLENLLFHNGDRIGCTVVPKRTVNLSGWASPPKEPKHFPIYIRPLGLKLKSPILYIVIEAYLGDYLKHQSEIIQVENFGEMIAWKASNHFEVILKTDIEHLTKLVYIFSSSSVDINHELQLLSIETVDVEGNVLKYQYRKIYPMEQSLRYSYAPVHWRVFVEEIKNIYATLGFWDPPSNPIIKIESGGMKADENKKVPVSEVKPIKKDEGSQQKTIEKESKCKLEVSAAVDVRKQHKRHDSKEEDTKKLKDQKALPKNVEPPPTKSKSEKRDSITEHKTKTKDCKTKDYQEHSSSRDDHRKQKKTKDDSKSKRDEFKNKGKHKSDKEVVSAQEEFRNVSFQSSSNSSSKKTKPPNVLVYADSVVAKENVKSVLHEILNKNKYTVYDLPTNSESNNQIWNNSTVLVVVCGTVPPHLTFHLLQYLVNGGQLLCLCSDLLHSVLHTFTTAEVREHELVRFSYGEWRRVRMMHHIFCYQASPAKKQFSKDSDQSNHSNGSSPVAPRTPSSADIQHNGKNYTIQVQVLGTEETWETPSLLLASVKDSTGKAIFSQVHLEIDPTQYQDDENKYAALKDSNQARLEIMKDILSNRLDMDCSSPSSTVTYTEAYFLGRHDMKLNFLSECEDIKDNQLTVDNMAVIFCGKDVKAGTATENRLPVLVHSCPMNFSTVQYFSTLKTVSIGRLVLYSEILTSTQNLINKAKLVHGIVVIARQQTSGVGRSNNKWISPLGCAAFSLQLHVPINSFLGQYLPLVQHMIMVAIVSAIRNKPCYENLSIGIKWPNDLYVNSNTKIGGLIVTSTITDNLAIVNIGCGVNLDNCDPTTCINDVIKAYNEKNKSKLEQISHEEYFAIVFNKLEEIYSGIQRDGVDLLYELYYKYWLHSGAEIIVTTIDGLSKKAIILGLDDFGYLKVRSEDGVISSVQPDGNTFDMLKGLIVPKTF